MNILKRITTIFIQFQLQMVRNYFLKMYIGELTCISCAENVLKVVQLNYLNNGFIG